MARGEAIKCKVHYKGRHDDFLVFVDDVNMYKKWKTDKTVSITHFVSSFKIFITHNQGAQGIYDTASQSLLDAEFGTHNDNEVFRKILESGSLQVVEMMDRQGPRNDSMDFVKAR